jgi:hypothetical protein
VADTPSEAGLKIVDAFDFDPELRALLRPGELVEGIGGHYHHLPRYFYEVPSHEAARDIRLTPHFGLNEFLLVDVKEAARLRAFPRYVPCAIRLLAFFLERIREAAGAPLHLAVNGGYRSPAHKLSMAATPHMWGTAADLYRVGTVVLRDRASIETYNRVIEDLTDDLYVMPYGHEIGEADDHIHVDLGYVTVVPREISEDRLLAPQEKARYAFEERRSGDRRGWPREPLPEVLPAAEPGTVPAPSARK